MANAVVLSEPPIPIRKGAWDRTPWVATRYELELAIQALLDRGKLAVDAGLLALPRRGDPRMRLSLASVPETREERWAREDDELRRYCQQLEPHETRSKKYVETSAPSAWPSYGGAPRAGVGRYVLRELDVGASSYLPLRIRRTGGDGYETVIATIEERGGLEWVLEEPKRMKARKR